MNTSLIKSTVTGSLTGTMKFPEIVGKLVAEGFESYHADLVRSENRYYMPNGESYVEHVDFTHPAAEMKFSAEQVEAAIRASQTGKINYKEFLNKMAEAGCVYYITYLAGKKVVYFGREGESHVEPFPGAK